MMFRRCKVRRFESTDITHHHAWIPIDDAKIDTKIKLAFASDEHVYVIVECDTLVVAGRYLPHLGEWPVERKA